MLHLRGHAVGSAGVLLVHVVVVVMVLLVEGGCGSGRRGRRSRVGVGRRHGVAVVGRGLRGLVSVVAVRLHDLDHLRRSPSVATRALGMSTGRRLARLVPLGSDVSRCRPPHDARSDLNR